MNKDPIQFSGWTSHATRFVWAPIFTWTYPSNAARFRLQIAWTADKAETIWLTEPQFDLTPLWPGIPLGQVDVMLTAVDAAEQTVANTWHKRFYKVPGPEVAQLRQDPLDYLTSVRRNLDYLLAPARDKVAPYEVGWPRSCWAAFEDNETGQRTRLGYPALHHPSFIFAYLTFAEAFPDDPRADEARRQARQYGQWLLDYRLPADWTCSLFPYSTIHEGKFEGGNEEQAITLFRAARVGEAMLTLYRVTGENDWLEYARHIAEMFVRLQRPDGTWPYRVNPRNATVTEDYTSNVVSPACLMALLEEIQPDPRYAAARHKAIAWLKENPVKTRRWQGMYEDVGEQPPFANLQHFDVDEAILYLTHFRTADPAFVPTAVELNRWVEDQFVVWGPELQLPVQPPTPTVLEQYVCYWPMECHTARWLLALIALHTATGDAEYLTKAIAAANSIVRGQQPSGAYSTWGNDVRYGRPRDTRDWPGCNALAVTALVRFQQYLQDIKTGGTLAIPLEGC